jgi:hypothetical protein
VKIILVSVVNFLIAVSTFTRRHLRHPHPLPSKPMGHNLIDYLMCLSLLLLFLVGVLTTTSYAQTTTAAPARENDNNTGNRSSRNTSRANSTDSSREAIERNRKQTDAVNTVTEGILDIFREKHASREAEEAEASERKDEELKRREAEEATEERERSRKRAGRDSVEEVEEDERARERERAWSEQQGKKKVDGKLPINSTTPITIPSSPRLVSGTAPAFTITFPNKGSWTPWYSMRDKNGINLIDLDVAYWSGGGDLPSDVRDFSMTWAVRNRTSKNLTLYYEVFVESVQNNPAGWLRFQHTIPAGKYVLSSKLHAWSVSNARALRVELAEDFNATPNH